MSAERKKLLLLSIFSGIFVLLLITVGFFLFTPKKGSAQAPATIGNSAPPKAQDPQDYLSAPPASPSLGQPKSQDGSVIVVYGDKPALPATGASSSAAGAAPQAEAPAAENTAQGKAAAATDKGVLSEGETNRAVSTKKKPSAKNAPTAVATATAKSVASKSAAKPAAELLAKPVVKADAFWIQAGSFASSSSRASQRRAWRPSSPSTTFRAKASTASESVPMPPSPRPRIGSRRSRTWTAAMPLIS